MNSFLKYARVDMCTSEIDIRRIVSTNCTLFCIQCEITNHTKSVKLYHTSLRFSFVDDIKLKVKVPNFESVNFDIQSKGFLGCQLSKKH